MAENLCVKIESSKNWNLLKGLRSFEISSKRFWVVRKHTHMTVEKGARQDKMGEEIRRVVTRID